MAANLEEIVKYLLRQDNEAELGRMLGNKLILSVHAGADAKIPAETAGKRTTRKRAAEIFAEAKQDADGIFSISPGLVNPDMESYGLFQLCLKDISLSALISGSGIAIAAAGMPAAGALAAGAGILYLYRTLREAYKEEYKSCRGMYIPLIDTILCCRSRENPLYQTMAHEYSHAVYYKLLNVLVPIPAYRAFEEGFAAAASNALARKKDESKRSLALLTETMLLKHGYISLHDMDFPGRVKSLFNEKKRIKSNDTAGIYGIGYSLFRLAEKRHGTKVYKEVLEGNDRIMFG